MMCVLCSLASLWMVTFIVLLGQAIGQHNQPYRSSTERTPTIRAKKQKANSKFTQFKIPVRFIKTRDRKFISSIPVSSFRWTVHITLMSFSLIALYIAPQPVSWWCCCCCCCPFSNANVASVVPYRLARKKERTLFTQQSEIPFLLAFIVFDSSGDVFTACRYNKKKKRGSFHLILPSQIKETDMKC